MQYLKYYVLWKKNSPLLKDYLDKFYIKILKNLNNINYLNFNIKDINLEKRLWNKIKKLLEIENKSFILNADISSLIDSITRYNEFNSIEKLEKEIDIFLLEWIESVNLNQNKWYKIAWTNIRLTYFDNNPYWKQEAHPDHIKFWAISWNWWEKTEEEWLKIYVKTFNLLKGIDEWIYDELNQIITKIIPLWTALGFHNSASYKECVWHLYMWYTIDSSNPEINNLEAIIHESSHNKLNLIMQFDPIVLNDREEKYYSAIRPDARHIHWVFLWYHAFAPTMYILMKAYKNWDLWNDLLWLEKIVLYYMKTKILQRVIKKYAKLTKIGEEVSEEIDYVILKMDILIKEMNISKKMLMQAKERQKEHFFEVNMNYTNLEY